MCSDGAKFEFPTTIPKIAITPTPTRLGTVDCRELRWWFVVPELGHSSSSGCYDTDTGKLESVRRVVSTTPTVMDAQAAVDIKIDELSCTGGDPKTFRFTCVLHQNEARWLAVSIQTVNGTTTTTVADPDFEAQWGPLGQRGLTDNGRYEPVPDGSYRLTDAQGHGAGVFMVTIGPRRYTCLRVLELHAADESNELSEAFVEPGGRTILYRQYRGRSMNTDWQQWRATHPGAEIRINDSLFLHRDCLGRAHTHLTDAAFDDSLALSR